MMPAQRCHRERDRLSRRRRRTATPTLRPGHAQWALGAHTGVRLQQEEQSYQAAEAPVPPRPRGLPALPPESPKDSDDDMWRAAAVTAPSQSRGQGRPVPAQQADPEDSDDDMWAAAAVAAPSRRRTAAIGARRSTGQPVAAPSSTPRQQRQTGLPEQPDPRAATRAATALQRRRTMPINGAEAPVFRKRRATEAAQPTAAVMLKQPPLPHMRLSQQDAALRYTTHDLHASRQSYGAGTDVLVTSAESAHRAAMAQQTGAEPPPPQQANLAVPPAVHADALPSPPSGPGALKAAVSPEVVAEREPPAGALQELASQLATIMGTVHPLSERLASLEERFTASAAAPASLAALVEGRIAALEAVQAAAKVSAPSTAALPALLEERLAVLETKVAAAQLTDGNLTAAGPSKDEHSAATQAAVSGMGTVPQAAPLVTAASCPQAPSNMPHVPNVDLRHQDKPSSALPADQPSGIQPTHGNGLAPCASSGAVLCQQGVCANTHSNAVLLQVTVRACNHRLRIAS